MCHLSKGDAVGVLLAGKALFILCLSAVPSCLLPENLATTEGLGALGRRRCWLSNFEVRWSCRRLQLLKIILGRLQAALGLLDGHQLRSRLVQALPRCRFGHCSGVVEEPHRPETIILLIPVSSRFET